MPSSYSHTPFSHGGTRSYSSINVDNTVEDTRGLWSYSYVRPILIFLGSMSIAAVTFAAGLRMGARLPSGDEYEDPSFPPKSIKKDFTGWFLTDVHVDPFFQGRGSCHNATCCVNMCEPFAASEPGPPILGCDPPIQLLDSALYAMKAIDPAVDFLFFTGDMPAHDLCNGKREHSTL